MKNIIFNLGFATILTHELDAMTQSEWRLLFILRNLPEQTASVAFVVIHVPLIAVLLWLTNNEYKIIKNWSRIVLAAFLVIHSGLHKLLENNPNYTFNSTLSLWLIYGAALLGLFYLILVFVSWLRESGKSLTTN
ncbi:hypothetical protein NIES267_43870 [Calothrix parasitica NIES-267]|uniref:Uncharacterized protein n=1 Tax=Calothrix parasitica NIES-267 TaxID=1973488 RepID=A0A1Z4LUJ2_9CYAN|nr:hypothetical protein NIES267_43870 [Calothrix parasitica NIES-267]